MERRYVLGEVLLIPWIHISGVRLHFFFTLWSYLGFYMLIE